MYGNIDCSLHCFRWSQTTATSNWLPTCKRQQRYALMLLCKRKKTLNWWHSSRNLVFKYSKNTHSSSCKTFCKTFCHFALDFLNQLLLFLLSLLLLLIILWHCYEHMMSPFIVLQTVPILVLQCNLQVM